MIAAAAEKSYVSSESKSRVTPKSQSVVEKVKCGFFKATEERSILDSCWGVLSQIS